MTIQRWTLVVVCAATAMLMLDIAVVNTALSRIAEDLNTGLSGLQWVVDAYTLALASTVLTAGALADRLGRRRVFSFGLILFTGASLACGLAQDITMLNTARAVQGLGAAVMFAVSLALLAHAYPGARERAGAFAAYGATIGASFAVGPLIGGLLTSGLDWQWIFLVNLPIGLFCLYVTRRYVQESRDPRSPGIDWPGQITLTAGLFLLVLALLRGNELGWTSDAILAELGGAVVALVAFVIIESRVREPMLPLKFFRNPSFTGVQIAAFSISASFFAVFLYTTLYLQQILGLSAIEAGLVYLPGTMVMLFVSGATAQLLAKVPARTVISIGLGMVGVGMMLFTLADVDVVVVDRPPRRARRADRHRPVQPGRDQRRAELGPDGAERRRRRRARHVPAGRHRGRRRRPRRADPGRERVRRRLRRRTSTVCTTPCGRAPAWRSSARSSPAS